MRLKGKTTSDKVAISPQSKVEQISGRKESMAMFILILGHQSKCIFAFWIAHLKCKIMGHKGM